MSGKFRAARMRMLDGAVVFTARTPPAGRTLEVVEGYLIMHHNQHDAQ